MSIEAFIDTTAHEFIYTFGVDQITKEQLKELADYLQQHPEITRIVLDRVDNFMLDNAAVSEDEWQMVKLLLAHRSFTSLEIHCEQLNDHCDYFLENIIGELAKTSGITELTLHFPDRFDINNYIKTNGISSFARAIESTGITSIAIPSDDDFNLLESYLEAVCKQNSTQAKVRKLEAQLLDNTLNAMSDFTQRRYTDDEQLKRDFERLKLMYHEIDSESSPQELDAQFSEVIYSVLNHYIAQEQFFKITPYLENAPLPLTEQIRHLIALIFQSHRLFTQTTVFNGLSSEQLLDIIKDEYKTASSSMIKDSTSMEEDSSSTAKPRILSADQKLIEIFAQNIVEEQIVEEMELELSQLEHTPSTEQLTRNTAKRPSSTELNRYDARGCLFGAKKSKTAESSDEMLTEDNPNIEPKR